jgi:hypothetical protein
MSFSYKKIHARRIAVVLVLGAAILAVAILAPIPWTVVRVIIGAIGGACIMGAGYDHKDYRDRYDPSPNDPFGEREYPRSSYAPSGRGSVAPDRD